MEYLNQDSLKFREILDYVIEKCQENSEDIEQKVKIKEAKYQLQYAFSYLNTCRENLETQNAQLFNILLKLTEERLEIKKEQEED